MTQALHRRRRSATTSRFSKFSPPTKHPPQFRHLWAASHALATTSPAVSAHLMARLHKLSFDQKVDLSEVTTPHHCCGACGAITMPGWNNHVRASSNHERKRKRKFSKMPDAPNAPIQRKEAKASKLRMIYECRTCGRSTTEQIPSLAKKKKSSNRVRSTLASENSASLSVQSAADVSSSSTTTNVRPSPVSSAPVPSQNASSKRRAKSRKGNSLSDILAAKKKQDSSGGGRGNGFGGFGLDLMDLAKTG